MSRLFVVDVWTDLKGGENQPHIVVAEDFESAKILAKKKHLEMLREESLDEEVNMENIVVVADGEVSYELFHAEDEDGNIYSIKLEDKEEVAE